MNHTQDAEPNTIEYAAKAPANAGKGVVLRLTFYATCQYDNHEHGAGYTIDGEQKFETWGLDASHMNAVIWAKPGEAIQDKLAEHLEKFCLDLSMFCIFENGRLTGNRDEDNDGAELSDEESTRRHKQLFLVDYDIMIDWLPNCNLLTTDKLQEFFPALTTY